MPSMPAAHYHQGLPCRDRSCAAANVPLEPGDLPEGKQSQPVSPLVADAMAAATRALDEEPALTYPGYLVVKRIVAAAVARVRADVAEDLWREAQRLRDEDWPAKVGIEYVEGFEAAVAWIERQTPRPPAESVVGAPTPISAPSDVAAPRDALTDQDFADFNETIADRDCSTMDSACHSVWLRVKWRWLTWQMTTEEKEAFADAVDRAGDVLADGESRLPVDRWWREPVGALPEDEGTRQEGLINVEE